MDGKTEFSVKDTHGLPFRPLSVWLPAPRRRPAGDLAGGRRPVVALVDTGVADDHPWFASGDADPVVTDATGEGWHTGGSSSRWHGTFVAGLIHQNGPDARILSVRLAQNSDGYIVDGQLGEALGWLLTYHAGGGEVDVVCIPMGFRPDADVHDATYIEGLVAQIAELRERGIIVLAAAGNKPVDAKAGTGEVYPAAAAADGGPLTAVGAQALNGERWPGGIHDIHGMVFFPGENVVSTTPMVDASAVHAHDSAADLNADCGSGRVDGFAVGARFGVGSGTSYAVAGYAGCVAQAGALGVPLASLLPAVIREPPEGPG
jgi:hypothetical protein